MVLAVWVVDRHIVVGKVLQPMLHAQPREVVKTHDFALQQLCLLLLVQNR